MGYVIVCYVDVEGPAPMYELTRVPRYVGGDGVTDKLRRARFFLRRADAERVCCRGEDIVPLDEILPGYEQTT
jgi:hypothetical protein